MTDKEQIIIDGVNVYGCVQFIQEEEDCCNLGGSCKGWPNCYYKQLARKTAKCEKYEQALDTVSEYIKDNCNFCQGIKYGGCEKCELKRIKDIINKVKG